MTATIGTATRAVGDDGVARAAANELTAQLSSRVFHAGGTVRGNVQLHLRSVTGDVNATTPTETALVVVVAHMHAHVTVDSNVLPLPLVSLVPPVATSENQQTPPPAEAENASPHSLDTTSINTSTSTSINKSSTVGGGAVALPLPDVRSFAGDGGACIFQSAPTTLFSGAMSESGDLHDEREFALALPATACPTFRGAAARVFYVLTVTARVSGSRSESQSQSQSKSQSVSVHLPFEVYAPEFFFRTSALESADEYAAAQLRTRAESDRTTTAVEGVGVDTVPTADNNTSTTTTTATTTSGDTGTDGNRSLLQRAAAVRSRQTRSGSVSVVPVGVRTGQELSFELRPSLMHGRVQTEACRKAQTSIFTIGKDQSHLVRFLLTKQSYAPGDVLLGVFDFAKAALPCYEVSATLCLEETLSALSLAPSRVVSSKEVGAFREFTGGVAVHTHVQFCIPPDAVPTIHTDLVSFQWLLRFEFTAGVAATSASASASGSGSGPSALASSAMQRQTFRWQVPVVVRPVAVVERSPSARLPRKLFSGSKRSVRLA